MPGLLSAVCILYWSDWYCCFCLSEPQVRTEIMELEKIFRPSWPLWLMCSLYVEELPRTSTMIEQWLLYTKWRRTQMLANMTVSHVNALLRGNGVFWNEPAKGFPRCEHFGFSIQFTFLEVQKCDLRLSLFLNNANILFLSTWVSELHRNYFFDFYWVGRGSIRDYFRSRSAMQLPSTDTTSVNICSTKIPHPLLSAWMS